MPQRIADALTALRDEAILAASLARVAGGRDEESPAGTVYTRLQGIAMMAANRLSSSSRVTSSGLESARDSVQGLIDGMPGVDLGTAHARMDAHLEAMMGHIDGVLARTTVATMQP